MATIKKISELSASPIKDDSEFIIIDKSEGKSKKVNFQKLKQHLEATGTKGSKGNKGDTGEGGSSGRKGIKGPAGNDGPKGFPGGRGDDGAKGPKGSKGILGDKGQKGRIATDAERKSLNNGQKGIKGQKGNDITGERGDKGTAFKGVKGPIGPTGRLADIGEKGIKGGPGPKGPKGQRGPNGLTTAGAGPRGDTGGPGSNSSVKGPKGPDGRTGAPGIDQQFRMLDGVDWHFTSQRNGLYIGHRPWPNFTSDKFTQIGSNKTRGSYNNFQKEGGTNGAWDAGVRSVKTYSGSVTSILSVSVNEPNANQMWGITSKSPTTGHYNQIEYAFYFYPLTGSNQFGVAIYESGNKMNWGEWAAYWYGGVVKATDPFTWIGTPGHEFRVEYDHVNKRIIYTVPDKNGNSIQSRVVPDIKWNSSTRLYASSSFYQKGDANTIHNTRYVTWR